MYVVFTLGLWGSVIGGVLVGATALTFLALKGLASIRGSPSSWEIWESRTIENLFIAFVIGAALSLADSVMLAADRIIRIVTLII